MASLADQLAQLTNPTPVFQDPLGESDDDTQAKVVEKIDDDDESTNQASILRRKSAALLEDTDKRYLGKKTSRKQLHQDSDEDDDGEDDDDEDDTTDNDDEDNGDVDDGDVDGEDVNAEMNGDDDGESEGSGDEDDDEEDIDAFRAKFKQQNPDKKAAAMSGSGSEDAEIDDDEDEEDGDESADEGGSSEDEEASDEDAGDEEGGIKKFSKSNVTDEVEKGKATRCQIGLWDSLLEMRIKLQKLLVLSNQLPQQQTWSSFTSSSEDFSQAAKEGHVSMKRLLDQLVELQTSLLMKNTETRHVITGDQPAKQQNSNTDADDEEITSESEIDSDAEDKKPDANKPNVLKRKLKTADYPEFLAKRHKDFTEFRNATIQKWYDKTRVAAGKIKSKSFSVFDQSALKQIDQILGDKDRLIKRTQVKRTIYRVLGSEEKPQEKEPDLETEQGVLPSRNHLKDYDSEIFDDDDFYHQLLRELIERKAADTNDPVALSRQWLEIQKLRNKVKKKVDTKASKGRKIRYNVHPKLINFMAPIDTCSWQDEAQDDLYSSLFGQRHKVSNPET